MSSQAYLPWSQGDADLLYCLQVENEIPTKFKSFFDLFPLNDLPNYCAPSEDSELRETSAEKGFPQSTYPKSLCEWYMPPGHAPTLFSYLDAYHAQAAVAHIQFHFSELWQQRDDESSPELVASLQSHYSLISGSVVCFHISLC